MIKSDGLWQAISSFSFLEKTHLQEALPGRNDCGWNKIIDTERYWHQKELLKAAVERLRFHEAVCDHSQTGRSSTADFPWCGCYKSCWADSKISIQLKPSSLPSVDGCSWFIEMDGRASFLGKDWGSIHQERSQARCVWDYPCATLAHTLPVEPVTSWCRGPGMSVGEEKITACFHFSKGKLPRPRRLSALCALHSPREPAMCQTD